MIHTENLAGPRKPDRVTFSVATQLFSHFSLYDNFESFQILTTKLSERTLTWSGFCYGAKNFLAPQTSLFYKKVSKKLRNGIRTICKTGRRRAEGTLESVCNVLG
jgi:hypothetical protein